MNEEKQRVLLTPKEIGDNLSLEDEGTYPCSDGGWTATISVDKLLKAQLDKAWDLAMMIGKDKGFLAGIEQGKKEGRRELFVELEFLRKKYGGLGSLTFRLNYEALKL